MARHMSRQLDLLLTLGLGALVTMALVVLSLKGGQSIGSALALGVGTTLMSIVVSQVALRRRGG